MTQCAPCHAVLTHRVESTLLTHYLAGLFTPAGDHVKHALPGPPPDLSIVVLGYRAGEDLVPFVEQIHDALRPTDIRYECILVANYWPDSGDPTPEVARRIAAAEEVCRVVASPKQGMMGWDMRSGLEAAHGDVIGVIDGDNQFPPESFPDLYRKLVDEELDVCKTVRVRREDGLYRRLISRVYNAVFRVLFPGVNFRDVNSKPKLIARRAYEKLSLESDDWFIDAEIMIQARRHRMRVGEMATTMRENTRASFVRPIAILEFVRNLLVYRVREFTRGP